MNFFITLHNLLKHIRNEEMENKKNNNRFSLRANCICCDFQSFGYQASVTNPNDSRNDTARYAMLGTRQFKKIKKIHIYT